MKQENHLQKAIDANIRYDGRERETFRPIEITYGVSSTAEGSAKVKIGDTEVIAGVKLEVGTPYPDMPKSGNLMVDVQLLPLSSEKFEQGPPSIDAIEIARVTDRGIRESKCVDMEELCIVEGEKVWVVSVDISTINVDGNLFDAVSLAAMAALKNTVFPKIEKDGSVNFKEKSKKSLPLQKVPIVVTVYR
ncbi:MAG: RNA-binding protein, partial [Candidatus Woesearchaeota archaeon]